MLNGCFHKRITIGRKSSDKCIQFRFVNFWPLWLISKYLLYHTSSSTNKDRPTWKQHPPLSWRKHHGCTARKAGTAAAAKRRAAIVISLSNNQPGGDDLTAGNINKAFYFLFTLIFSCPGQLDRWLIQCHYRLSPEGNWKLRIWQNEYLCSHFLRRELFQIRNIWEYLRFLLGK